MKLNEIKAHAALNNITMSELSLKIGIERRLMYLKIKKQDSYTLRKIKNFFSLVLILK